MAAAFIASLAAAFCDPPACVRIGGLFPMVQTSGKLDQSGMLRLGAFLLAIDEINNSTDLLPNTHLDFVLRDSRRDNLAALVGALEVVGSCSSGAAVDEGIVAAVGAASSGPSESAAAAFARARVPQISYSSTSPALSDGEAHPFFLRTPPSDAFQAEAMVDVLTNLFNYSTVATVSSTDKYGTAGISAFRAAAASANLRVLTSQSITEGAPVADFELVYRALSESRARVIVLFCQASEAGRFLRGAYKSEPRLGGEGFLFLGSDAVSGPATWDGDDALRDDLELRNSVLGGFFGLTASYGQGSAAYAAYRARLAAHSAVTLPAILPALASTNGCCMAERNACGSLAATAEDADGRSLWTQLTGDIGLTDPQDPGNSTVCIGLADPLAENAYSPFAYDATYAIAHALHALVEGGGATSIDGDDVTHALLHNGARDASLASSTVIAAFSSPPPPPLLCLLSAPDPVPAAPQSPLKA